MSNRFVRASKYRHVYGQPYKKESTYDNVKVSLSAWDTDLVKVNTEYLSLNYQVSGGGAFLVCPLSRMGKLPDVYPLVRAHSGPVLDTSWSPFDSDLIASAGEDCRVQITRIDRDKLESVYDEETEEIPDLLPVSGYNYTHARKVGHVLFHPTAAHILASASSDVKLWDLERPNTARIELQTHPDIVQSMTWNGTGSLLATTCRDKKVRLFDPRASTTPIRTAESHTGVKSSRIVWLGDLDRIVTTGFSRTSTRQIFLWDVGQLGQGDSQGRTKEINLDSSSGTLMPYYSDNNILFIAGKGDGNIRYYEYESDDLVYLNEFKSSDPQRGIGFLPRRGLNVSECEIARAYKVAGTSVEPISFIVPRKSDAFQSDIYPPAPSSHPAMTAEEFFGGKTASPVTVNLDSQTENASTMANETIPAPIINPAQDQAKSSTEQSKPSSPVIEQQQQQKSSPTKIESPIAAATTTTTTTTPALEHKPEPEPELEPEPEVITKSEPTPSPSPVKNSQPALSSGTNGNNVALHEELQALTKENESLKAELAKKDAEISRLELQREQLVSAQRKAVDLLGSI